MTEPTAPSKSPKFWMTCWKCKTKIGASPQLVLKYLARILRLQLEDLKAQYPELTNAAKE